MWLVALTLAAVISTIFWYFKDDGRYRLDILSLIFWGSTIMVFIDHAIGYYNDVILTGLEEGTFVEISWQAFMLSILLVCAGIMLWILYLVIKKPKGVTHKS